MLGTAVNKSNVSERIWAFLRLVAEYPSAFPPERLIPAGPRVEGPLEFLLALQCAIFLQPLLFLEAAPPRENERIERSEWGWGSCKG